MPNPGAMTTSATDAPTAGFLVRMTHQINITGTIVRYRIARLPRLSLIVIAAALSLPGCDMVQQKLGIEDSAAKTAKADAEGKAVGGACRQSGRAIEDCYSIYSWLPKASIYEGWREMDAYMRENKIETIEPQLPPAPPPAPPQPAGKKKKSPTAEDSAKKEAEKPAEKAAEKAAKH